MAPADVGGEFYFLEWVNLFVWLNDFDKKAVCIDKCSEGRPEAATAMSNASLSQNAS